MENEDQDKQLVEKIKKMSIEDVKKRLLMEIKIGILIERLLTKRIL